MDNPIEALLAAIRAGNRQEMLGVLREMGTGAFDPLVAMLRSTDVELRGAAATLLGDLGDARAVPMLIDALEHDADGEVRLWAASSLGGMPDTRSIEPLIARLSDAAPSVRETVTRTLGEIGMSVGGGRISRALEQALHDTDWGTRQSASEMIIRLGGEAYQEAESLLFDDLQSGDVEIRLGAAWSLMELGDERALDPLVDLLKHNETRVAQMAAVGLGMLGDQRALVSLNAALNHPEKDVQEAARDALRRLGVAD